MLRDINCKCEIIKNFTPSWFALVMGTGILAMTSLFYSQYIPFLKNISFLLFYFNTVLFFILLIPWILRWIIFKKEALKDLEHPVISNFYATIAIGMLVLSANFLVFRGVLNDIFWNSNTIHYDQRGARKSGSYKSFMVYTSCWTHCASHSWSFTYP